MKTTKLPEPRVVGKSLENFIGFDIGNLSFKVNISSPIHFSIIINYFKDSFKFLPSSLDTLVKNLKNKTGVRIEEKFKHTAQMLSEKYPHVDKKHLPLLTRKGIYPYDWASSFEKLDEDIPTDRSIYTNSMTKKKISKEDYDFLCELKNIFNLRKLRDLHDLYLACDVSLLADVFENFREWSLSTYELDPAHFLTAPSLSWIAALKFTRVKLEIIKDVDMSLFIDEAVVGGISLIGNAYAKANNARLKEGVTDGKKSFIMIFDCNNQVIDNCTLFFYNTKHFSMVGR